MTCELDVPEPALRLGPGSVRRQAARHELGHARLEMERDFRVHILLRESGTVDSEPEESTGAGREHRHSCVQRGAIAASGCARDGSA
jgi:hypothetical protein